MGILDDSVTYQAAVAEYTRRGRLEVLAEGERHGEQRGHQLGHQQGLSQGRHQCLKEGELQGKQHEAQSLVLRQLPRRCGQLSQSQELAVRALPLEQLESLVGRRVGDLVGDLFIASPVGLA
jgi:flagellar biosynthesis/type III secretory pathway protein FliH